MTVAPTRTTVTATHVVRSAHAISLQEPFALGAFDQLGHYATPINVVWIYELSTSADLIPIARLHRAISRLLDYYPHLNGRVHIDESTGLRSVTRLGAGMHLLEASCDRPLSAFRNVAPGSESSQSVFDLPGAGLDLLPPWDLSLEGTQRDPLFMIQRTEFACSAVAIGVRLSHVVCGAGGFLRLYQDLAEIYREVGILDDAGTVQLTSPPRISPFMADQVSGIDSDEREVVMTQIPSDYRLEESNSAASSAAEKDGQINELSLLDPVVGRSLHFSAAEIATLKTHAMDANDTAQMSAFTVLSAHLWQRTHMARLAQASDTLAFSTSTLGTSVDFSRVVGLSPRYFGNSVVTPLVHLDSAELVSKPLSYIASAINSHIRSVSAEQTQSLGKWIASQPDKKAIKLDFQMLPSSFIATGWHVFPLYTGAELDEAPVFASAVWERHLLDGMAYFLQPKQKDGGLDAIMSLRESVWKVLDGDEGFVKGRGFKAA